MTASAGRGDGGIKPAVTAGVTVPVELVCVRRDHYEAGLSRPDGSGHYTLHRERWAYCAAGKPSEEHTWKATGGIEPQALRHDIDWLSSPRGEDSSGSG